MRQRSLRTEKTNSHIRRCRKFPQVLAMNATCSGERITATATTKPPFIYSFQRALIIAARAGIVGGSRVATREAELTKILQDNGEFVGSTRMALFVNGSVGSTWWWQRSPLKLTSFQTGGSQSPAVRAARDVSYVIVLSEEPLLRRQCDEARQPECWISSGKSSTTESFLTLTINTSNWSLDGGDWQPIICL